MPPDLERPHRSVLLLAVRHYGAVVRGCGAGDRLRQEAACVMLDTLAKAVLRRMLPGSGELELEVHALRLRRLAEKLVLLPGFHLTTATLLAVELFLDDLAPADPATSGSKGFRRWPRGPGPSSGSCVPLRHVASLTTSRCRRS